MKKVGCHSSAAICAIATAVLASPVFGAAGNADANAGYVPPAQPQASAGPVIVELTPPAPLVGTCDIIYDGSPGTSAPPSTLGPYTMTPFGDDTRPVFSDVNNVPAPGGGLLKFSIPMSHREIGDGWATWSHGYAGDVYYTGGDSEVTLGMPGNTVAFYFYVEPNQFAQFEFEAVADTGTSSGKVLIEGSSGAKYFGFYVQGPGTLKSVKITNTDGASGGFAVGEFGIDRGRIAFDGSPGTSAPPAMLGPYMMNPFPDDTRPVFEDVLGVPSPCGGGIEFDIPLSHREIGDGWATWSHGYAGDVYYTGGADKVTVMMPDDTAAFYLYVEPNSFAEFEFEAVSNTGTTSGTVLIDGDAGAKYFGFYANGAGELLSITIVNIDGAAGGFSIGEFACASVDCTGVPCQVLYDGSPGVKPPPSVLGPYPMTPFGDDPRPNFSDVSDVQAPGGGQIKFSIPMSLREIGDGWATWSHGYTGDVYYTGGDDEVVVKMPDNTVAFYFYVEPNQFATFDFEAVSSTGTTSGTVQIEGSSGAKYFGFFMAGSGTLNCIRITNTDGASGGFAIGEFGIARGKIVYDGSPGTAAPPGTLGFYAMTPFDLDPRPVFTDVKDVSSPCGGDVLFDIPLSHRRIGDGWATWSHGYAGDVYYTGDANKVSLGMPAGTAAFYLYVEPNQFSTFEFEAVSNTGTSSGSVFIDGSSGAKYFGFYAAGGGELLFITIVNTDGGAGGFAIGEFGCAAIPCPPCPGDVTGNGVVDVLDLLDVLAAWGQFCVPADANGDGIVDVLDLLEVLTYWGPC